MRVAPTTSRLPDRLICNSSADTCTDGTLRRWGVSRTRHAACRVSDRQAGAVSVRCTCYSPVGPLWASTPRLALEVRMNRSVVAAIVVGAVLATGGVIFAVSGGDDGRKAAIGDTVTSPGG